MEVFAVDRQVDLIRLEQASSGTFGVLRLDGEMFCVTLEPADRNNAPDVSCIPAGRYGCRRVDSPRFGETFEVIRVPGRSHILFHAGNVADDTRGCVLLGNRIGTLNGKRAVLGSGKTLARFMERLQDVNRFDLTIDEMSR